jgi:hypothetical protein
LTFDFKILTFKVKTWTFNVNILILDLEITMYQKKERKQKKKTIIRVGPGTQEKTWCVKCNKTIKTLHFVQYDALWSTEKQYCVSVPHNTLYRTQ